MKFVLLALLLLLPLGSAFAEEPSLEQITSNGLIKVRLHWPQIVPGELQEVEVRFLDPQTNKDITKPIYFTFAVVQNERPIEHYPDMETMEGWDAFEVMFPADSTEPAQVIVLLHGMGTEGDWTVMSERLVFDGLVVPEFDTLALTVMAVSTSAALVLGRLKRPLLSR